LHQIVIPVQDFYSIDEGEEVFELAFVFRNINGNLVGRESDGGDIFVPLYNSGGNSIVIVAPEDPTLLTNDEEVSILALSSNNALLRLFLDESLLVTLNDTNQIGTSIQTADYTEGQHWMYFEAEFENETLRDSVAINIMSDTQILPLPEGLKEGITCTPGSDEVSFNLFAPGKGRIYLAGDFNDWQFSNDYLMYQSPDGNNHWITIDGLDLTEEYGFIYYLADEGDSPYEPYVLDPYAEKVLDAYNDNFIDDEVYPDLKQYPSGIPDGLISVFQIEQEEYEWNDQDYERPDKTNLVVYELLVRDFTEGHSYQLLTDTLDYLERLGVNAIELMPINEFEGNISWGYNPNYYFAPDKYYGPKNAYKAFIDECHNRGIAVIMDIALNHSFRSNPQVYMYFDPNAGQYGQPTADNPWFNEVAKHDFNVGYDYDHSSPYTKKFVDSVLVHWVNEYHVDGYRLDLSKGFTQNNTLGDVSAWGQYDQSRIDILTGYANHLWANDESIYMILEHFADNDEETVLANTGFMLWGNLNHEYTEASMGYASNLNWGSYEARGWDNPHLVTYMESHDEERMMFKNLNYGASAGSYDITELETGLERCELAAAFFFPIPGPKMIWQFGELGYDYSINYCEDGTINDACRVSPKPVRWDYYDQEARRKLYNVYKELIYLKKEYPVFSTDDYVLNVGGSQKSIQLQSEEMNVTVIGNFATSSATMDVSFVHGGYWYEYFSGDSLMAGDFAPESISMAAGEYRLYTDVKLGNGVVLSVDDAEAFSSSSLFVYPNPGRGEFTFEFPEVINENKMITIYSVSGKIVDQINLPAGQISWKWNSPENLPKGMYFVKLVGSGSESSTRLIIE
jgi:glycosidase